MSLICACFADTFRILGKKRHAIIKNNSLVTPPCKDGRADEQLGKFTVCVMFLPHFVYALSPSHMLLTSNGGMTNILYS